MQEIWKDIKGYEGYYQVSNLGRVKSLERSIQKSDGKLQRVKQKILKQRVTTAGYNQVPLYKDGKSNAFYVHRLVATYFCEKNNNGRYVNHIDNNPLNNTFCNLEWCKHMENIQHMVSQNRHPHGISHGMSKFTEEDIVKIRSIHKNGDSTLQQIGELYGVGRDHIWQIVKRKIWKHI